jgi:cytochrome c-type biogenesis protein
MSENLSVFLAFGAGLLSFLSPCVLPLIPSYLCIIGGVSLGNGSRSNGTGRENSGAADTGATEGGGLQGAARTRLVAGPLSFILGFSAVFSVLSVLFSATFSLLGGVSRWISFASGVIVILLGLNIIFDFLSFLNYEKRFSMSRLPGGIAGTFLAGAAFGAGWTPCVGPILGSILLLAGQSGGTPAAVLYLTAYSAGLGLPFLLASVFFSRFLKTAKKLRPRLPLIRRISGTLLIVIGVLMLTGHYQALSALTARWQGNAFSQNKADGETESAAAKNNAKPKGGAETGMAQAGAAAADSANKGEGGATGKTVPGAVIKAFTKAGLPIVSEGIEQADFTLPLTDGSWQTLSSFNGKAVFLNFWATWCGPCRAEMPSMESIYQELKNEGFEILAVNVQEDASKVSVFMKEKRFSFPAALDQSGMVSTQYGIQALPTTYIIDRRGLIISRVVGSINWDKPEIIAALRTLLE